MKGTALVTAGRTADNNIDNNSAGNRRNKRKTITYSAVKPTAKGTARQQGCSIHRTASHGDEEHNDQGAPRPEQGAPCS